MKAKTIGYWVTTAIVSLLLLSGGVMQVTLKNAEGFKRVKEWAYAGIFIDFTGAAVTAAACQSGAAHIIAPLICAAMLVASWALRPANRILGSLAQL